MGATSGIELERLLERPPRLLARLVSRLEAGGEPAQELLAGIYARVGRARVIGITGPPGSGKSTLVDRFARLCRAGGETVAVLAVDPSSPFSGGALLGDRVRMQQLYTDPGVFIRSMATRGALGGLARATRDAIDLLDAAGFDWVLVETVGVGQDEVDIVRTVDTVVVVTVPGLGDEIQAIKAGIMEIADVFVVNKADRPGVEATVRDLASLVAMSDSAVWKPPIVETAATENRGIDQLRERIEEHQHWLDDSGERQLRRRQQLRLRVEKALQDRILAAADHSMGLEEQLRRGFERREDPYTVAARLFRGVLDQREEQS